LQILYIFNIKCPTSIVRTATIYIFLTIGTKKCRDETILQFITSLQQKKSLLKGQQPRDYTQDTSLDWNRATFDSRNSFNHIIKAFNDIYNKLNKQTNKQINSSNYFLAATRTT